MLTVMSLINGEKIIGDTESTLDEYKVKNPFTLEYVTDKEYGEGMKIHYLLSYAKNNCITIKNNMVLYSYIPNDTLEEYYKKLVEYKLETTANDMLEKAIREMDDMDAYYRKLITRRFIGDKEVN